MVARAQKSEQGSLNRAHARCRGDACFRAFHNRHALLKRGNGGVVGARIGVARLAFGKHIGALLRAVKHKTAG